MLLEYLPGGIYPPGGKAGVVSQFQARLQPEFRFAGSVGYMDMGANFLARKEIKAIALQPQDGRAHAEMLQRISGGINGYCCGYCP